MGAEVGKKNIVHPALGTTDAMIDVAPLREFNTGVLLLPVLLKFSQVAALSSTGERIFLLERLATEELVEPGMVLHSLTAAGQNLLENLMVPAGGSAVVAVAQIHSEGDQSVFDDRILQGQDADIRAGSLSGILFGNRNLDIDTGIVVGVVLRLHIKDISISSILVDEVAEGLNNPLTFVLRDGIEPMISSTATVAVLNEDGRLDDGGKAVEAEADVDADADAHHHPMLLVDNNTAPLLLLLRRHHQSTHLVAQKYAAYFLLLLTLQW